jgi:two-component system nitrogen regulation sensor histidine kinase NtrY
MKHRTVRRLTPELQQALVALAGSLIPSGLALAGLWYLQVSPYLWMLAAVLLVLLALFVTFSIWRNARFQLRSLHNLLEAMVKGNYTLRGARGQGGAYDSLVIIINELADTLHRQRLRSEEKQLLLLKVINQIDVAILAWDDSGHIQLVNPAAAELLDIKLLQNEKASGNDVAEPLPACIDFARTMRTGQAQLRDLEFGQSRGRYMLFKERFFADGNTHHLLFMTNIAGILRVEEKKAWQHLIRVLSHEINNSLAPLHSLSRSLCKQVELREQDQALAAELIKGLSIVERRAQSLTSFLQRYKTLASLPEPLQAPVDLKQLVTGVCELFAGQAVRISGLPIIVKLDAGQMEQVLVNLLKNAVEANASATAADAHADNTIEIGWSCEQHQLTLFVSDTGIGIASEENLFTPFYTTKSQGSGIGLSLCRQIVEAHGGLLQLGNRKDRSGCIVSIVLPLLDGQGASFQSSSA